MPGGLPSEQSSRKPVGQSLLQPLRLRHRRYICTLCRRQISVAHFLRHLESHHRQAVIDQASIRREWERFREFEESV